ncbi:Nucleotide-binding universal stress protein, UspA family [Maribacter sedimenticola]|uniref:Nucleotide-binding universal stress protein, UspA family n=1 Tax=Maribacter sedimenticola TaxID=228956 RepID=A0ABY1SD98_9FLAO|nr:universal stress protein [Maribacter sedimenticola]SNR28192.1 Nucleotide-binding universal stress protein, UspA family [Maribacter sedimenticola]
MVKKLLLPTDFSKNSWNAIQYAIQLYKNQECDFYILNTYAKEAHGLDNITLLDPDEAFNKYSELRSNQGLGDIMAKLTFENNNRKHRFHMLSRSALFLNAIKDIVAQMKIHMVVMGAKGCNNENTRSYGKNTLSVIEHIRQCPVLVVPENVRFKMPKEIVLTTNFKTNFKSKEIKYLVEMAQLHNAHIQILSLTDQSDMTLWQRRNQKRLYKHLKGVNYCANVVHNVAMATALSCFVEIKHTNMISYIDKKPSFWERLGFGKRTLTKLGYFNDVPVLALHGGVLKK